MQFQKPVLIQKQELRLSPQLLQSIQLLALPLLDLKARIEAELEVNPALELLEDKGPGKAEELPLQSQAEIRREDGDYFENSSDPGYDYDFDRTGGAYDDEAGDNKRRFMEGALSRPESLHEHLEWQLRLQPLDQEDFRIGELLIRNLDENGFHREDPATFLSPEQLARSQTVMELIQTFEPAGTCVADYKESLRCQARQYAIVPAGVLEIIDNHLEALEKGKHREIAKALQIDPAEVQEALHFIQQLTPFPGRLYSSDSPQYVVPDLQVVRRDDQFVIILNDEEIPVLGINPFFDQLLAKKSDGADVQQFVQSKLRDAKWFINSLKIRNETLIKVARALLEFQREFFLKGPKAIIPLTLKDIAGEIGVHETTVSRLTNGKYMQTEWGLYELKFFFSSAVSGTAGETYSKEGVKQVIKEIVVEEGGKILSDQKISDMLEKRGIKLARRTVAKYRKELDIDSSYDR